MRRKREVGLRHAQASQSGKRKKEPIVDFGLQIADWKGKEHGEKRRTGKGSTEGKESIDSYVFISAFRIDSRSIVRLSVERRRISIPLPTSAFRLPFLLTFSTSHLLTFFFSVIHRRAAWATPPLLFEATVGKRFLRSAGALSTT